MILTNEEIVTYYNNLEEIKTNSSSLPIKVSYAVIRNLNTLKTIAFDIEKTRQGIIDRLNGTLDEETGVFHIVPEDIPKADRQFKDLGEVENDVKIYTFPLSLLDGYDIDLKTMNALFFMIEDGEG